MTSEGLGEMFEGDSADMCAGKFLLMSMGGRAEGCWGLTTTIQNHRRGCRRVSIFLHGLLTYKNIRIPIKTVLFVLFILFY